MFGLLFGNTLGLCFLVRFLLCIGFGLLCCGYLGLLALDFGVLSGIPAIKDLFPSVNHPERGLVWRNIRRCPLHPRRRICHVLGPWQRPGVMTKQSYCCPLLHLLG